MEHDNCIIKFFDGFCHDHDKKRITLCETVLHAAVEIMNIFMSTIIFEIVNVNEENTHLNGSVDDVIIWVGHIQAKMYRQNLVELGFQKDFTAKKKSEIS